MNKILRLLIVTTILLVGCSKNHKEIGTYTLVYKVYYSESSVKEYTVTSDEPFFVYSERGTNYVKYHNNINEKSIIETSAPIEIVSETYSKIK